MTTANLREFFKNKVSDFDHEEPDKIFRHSCSLLGAALKEKANFKYIAKNTSCEKLDEEITFRFTFQSKPKINKKNEMVYFSPYFWITSKGMNIWGEKHQVPWNSDQIIAGQLGSMSQPETWLEWNLVDPSQRPFLLENIFEHIEKKALPLVQIFSNPKAAVEKLLYEDIFPMEINNIINFVHYFSDENSARVVAQNYLRRHSHLIRNYQEKLDNYSEGLEEFVPYSNDPAGMLAWSSLYLNLGTLSL
ncbi:MAG: hypothetical protein KIT34_17385 [Cyanobacteria bacterium TGS_CYA1]|nr:hypothetical protein [Cyanobacteria bacterium TGS_CYA1]